MMTSQFCMTKPIILFEDNDVLVINKPVGMSVHSGKGNESSKDNLMVVDWFLERCSEAYGVMDLDTKTESKDLKKFERSGIVHRLDRDTSGAMILAKTQYAYNHLKKQFHDRLVKKEYRAFVYGAMREKWGTIDRKIGRSAKNFRLRSAQRGAKGTLRDAVTNWEVIGTGIYKDEHFSYVKLLPSTGRMHQLRVHLKSIDRPIVGDRLYGGAKMEHSNNLELSRLALHANILSIILPSGNEERFIAPVPHEFEVAAERIAES